MGPVILFVTLVLIVGWFVTEIYGRRWMRMLLGVTALIAAGSFGYKVACVTVAMESMEQHEHMLLESSMKKMEKVTTAGDLAAVSNAIVVYNHTLAGETNRHYGHYRAALEMSSALKDK